MSLNIGGAADSIDIGVQNDSGASRTVGDVVQIKIGDGGFKCGVPVVANEQCRFLTGVVVGRPGHVFAEGEDMMMRIFGPCKAKCDATGNVLAGGTLTVVNGADHFTLAATGGAPASADAAAVIRGTSNADTGGTITEKLVDVWLHWPNG
tara:strand:+ start:53 stop:502 length:450 start_codon:yes stop_codon:yes gene_type:complete